MHLTLVIPTLVAYSRLEVMLDTVKSSTVQPDQIIIIDNGRKLLYKPWMLRHPDVDIYIPHSNLGVAGSCNQALRMTQQWWFHCNDDIELDPTLIERMTTAIKEGDCETFHHMYLPDYGVGSAFTCFMMHRNIIDEIGWWDDSFFPIYFEDNDFGYRMNLAGIKRKVVEGCKYYHHTSSSLNAMSAEEQRNHHENFVKLREYYERKWGGPPEHEKFSRPFDGESAIEVDKMWWRKFGRES